MANVNTFGRVLGATLIAVANAMAQANERDNALAREREEADRWERRKRDVYETVERALVATHHDYTISPTTKQRTAARLRADAVEFSNRRSDAMMRMVEEQAARFEMRGTLY